MQIYSLSVFRMPPVQSKRDTYRTKYTQEDYEHAVSAIRTGMMSLVQASKVFSVPKTTLHDATRGKVAEGRKSGRVTMLTELEEEKLVEHVQYMQAIGYPMTLGELQSDVAQMLKNDVRKKYFKDGVPGKV